MTLQEILEGNRLISEIMGSEAVYTDHSEYDEDGSMKYDHNGDGTPWIIETWTKPDWFSPVHLRCFGWGSYNMIENMLYHSSWDWLMPVVEKIENLKMEGYNIRVGIDSTRCFIAVLCPRRGRKKLFYRGFYNDNNPKITRMYKVVVEFIKWYNSWQDGN